MVRKSFIDFALLILERFLILDIPFEINFKEFNQNMFVLLSKQDQWSEIWNNIYPKLSDLVEKLKRSDPYIKIQNQLKVIKFFIITLIIISGLMSIFNPLAFIIVPFMVLILFSLIFIKKIILRKKIIQPNTSFIKKLVKTRRLEIVNLIKFLRLHTK